ncbi:MAG: TetR/AcrR family transcriptional regulator [Fibrobacteres bacterium]|jgi:AcrR family transcriptional regulator|nr:TetR/AcrR family transcriptional regulator [Fibrobacterota bacterium]
MKPVDRRIQKTKQVLSESLIALILEKGYEHVTIQDVIDKANVGRSTFYSHYENKDQLLMEGHRNLGVVLIEEMDADGKAADPAIGFLPLFSHAGQNLNLAKAMLGKMSGDIFTGHLKNHLSEVLRERYRHRFGKTKQEKLWLKYHAAAAAAALMAFLISWVEDDLPFTAEAMAEKCAAAVSAIFGQGRKK